MCVLVPSAVSGVLLPSPAESRRPPARAMNVVVQQLVAAAPPRSRCRTPLSDFCHPAQCMYCWFDLADIVQYAHEHIVDELGLPVGRSRLRQHLQRARSSWTSIRRGLGARPLGSRRGPWSPSRSSRSGSWSPSRWTWAPARSALRTAWRAATYWPVATSATSSVWFGGGVVARAARSAAGL